MSYKLGPFRGNLTADPELRFTDSGRPVASMTVAHNRRVIDEATGEWTDAGDADYRRVTVWGAAAQNAAETLRRGDPVVVMDARPEVESYTTKDSEVRSQMRHTAAAVLPDLGRAPWPARDGAAS